PAPRVTAAATMPLGLNPDRLREYQDRLRALAERARLPAAGPSRGGPLPPPKQEERGARPIDPLDVERKRLEYDSLFAGNVVLSRRPVGQQPLGDRDAGTRSAPTANREAAAPTPPNLDDVAAALVRASARFGPGTAPGQPPAASAPTPPASMP